VAPPALRHDPEQVGGGVGRYPQHAARAPSCEHVGERIERRRVIRSEVLIRSSEVTRRAAAMKPSYFRIHADGREEWPLRY
jgi:hypothetical protein